MENIIVRDYNRILEKFKIENLNNYKELLDETLKKVVNNYPFEYDYVEIKKNSQFSYMVVFHQANEQGIKALEWKDYRYIKLNRPAINKIKKDKKMRDTKKYQIYNMVFCELLQNDFGDEYMREFVLNKVNKTIARTDHKITAKEYDSLFYGSLLSFDRELFVLKAVYDCYVKDFTIFQAVTFLIEVAFKYGNRLSDKSIMEITDCKKSDINFAYKALGADDMVA